jgi:hypothetical protein
VPSSVSVQISRACGVPVKLTVLLLIAAPKGVATGVVTPVSSLNGSPRRLVTLRLSPSAVAVKRGALMSSLTPAARLEAISASVAPPAPTLRL